MKLSELIADIKAKETAEEKPIAPVNMAVSFYNHRFTGGTDDITRAVKNFKATYGIDIMELEVTAQTTGAAYGQNPGAIVVFIDSKQVTMGIDTGAEDGDSTGVGDSYDDNPDMSKGNPDPEEEDEKDSGKGPDEAGLPPEE